MTVIIIRAKRKEGCLGRWEGGVKYHKKSNLLPLHCIVLSGQSYVYRVTAVQKDTRKRKSSFSKADLNI